MRCKKADGTYVTVTYKLFYPACSNANLMCNKTGGAYVAAITVCCQGL
jgi:hypothetical protein